LPSWPIIGSLVIDPNIEHHQNPRTILTGTFWSRNSQPILASLPIVVLLFMARLHIPALALLLACTIGNEVHAWNHGLSMPRWAQFLQEMGLIQARRQHNQHHIRPWDKSYCTLTNLVNPILDLGFWRFLEWLIPVEVKRTSPLRRGY
jgi:hypothetical protein